VTNYIKVCIRGRKFRNIDLANANFQGSIAGIQRSYRGVLIILFCLLSTLSSVAIGTAFMPVLASIGEFLIPNLIAFSMLGIFFVSITVQGIRGALLGGGILSVVALIGITPLMIYGYGEEKIVPGVLFGIYGLTVAFSGILMFAFTITVIGVLAKSWVKNAVDAISMTVTLASIPLIFHSNGLSDWLKDIVLTEATLAIGFHIAKHSLSGESKFSFVRSAAIVFSTWRSTSFRGADLTNADFTRARVKNVDFRGANLTNTRWKDAKYLDYACVDNNYLQYPKIQNLVTTLQGKSQNFDRLNLEGINLQGANLQYASFIGTNLNKANLQDADLSRAFLKQAQLDGADLTGATLTGATIEDWGITRHTKLDGVRCEYVFMRLLKQGDLDENRHRKPDNWLETFSDGEFADFIKPLVDTLDLYHKGGVDSRAVALAFKQLVQKHPEDELEIVAMERRSQENLLLRVKTAPDADRSELSTQYFQSYNSYKDLPKEELVNLVAQRDGQVQSLEIAFRTVTRGLKEVAETPKYDMRGSNFPGGFAETNYGKMVETQFNSMSQDLSQAATQIQQLLNQLQTQGYSQEESQQQAAQDLAEKAQSDPTVKDKLVKWGQALGDTAAKTTVSEAATAVVKLALNLAGMPLP
jgi:uncharacterized protein YjbI with pentapeptide repeats